MMLKQKTINQKLNIFDWDKLNKFIEDRKPVDVDAGILGDWFWTAATIYEDGKLIDDHNAFTRSCWATPGFKATIKNGDVIEVECFKTISGDELAEYEDKHEQLRLKRKKEIEDMENV